MPFKKIRQLFKKKEIKEQLGPVPNAYEEVIGEYAGRRTLPEDPLKYLRKHFVMTEDIPITHPQRVVYYTLPPITKYKINY